MRFYIASRLENAELVKELSGFLKAAGHTHTYDWTEHGSVQCEGAERIAEVAEAEKRGVMDAQLVIVLLPGGRGTHTELGIALGAGKKIVICADSDELFMQDERTCAFYWNEGVERIVGHFYMQVMLLIDKARALDADARAGGTGHAGWVSPK